jgi:hypothetical protein
VAIAKQIPVNFPFGFSIVLGFSRLLVTLFIHQPNAGGDLPNESQNGH